MNDSFEWLQEHRSVITKNRQGFCVLVLNIQQIWYFALMQCVFQLHMGWEHDDLLGFVKLACWLRPTFTG